MPHAHSSGRAKTPVGRLLPLVSVVWGLLRDDPTHLAIQGARSLPARVRTVLGKVTPPDVLPATVRAFLFTMADRRNEAELALEQAGTSVVANELRVAHGVKLADTATPTQRARQLWEVGDLDGALNTAPKHSALRRTLQSYERTLREGSALAVPRVERTRGTRQVGTGSIRVFHNLTNSLPWTQSGYTLRSHRILAALKDVGIEAEAMTRVGYPLDIGKISTSEADDVDGVTYRRFLPRRQPGSLDAKYAAQARELAINADRFGADILHTTTPYSNALITEAAARALGIPWVYEARGEMESTWLASRPEWAQREAQESQRYRLMRAKETEMATRADAVVVLSNVQRMSLIERGVPAAKITVVSNAVDLSHLTRTHTPDEARAELGLGPGPWVGTVSAIVDYEGLDTLIDALALLKAEGTRVNAAIVGDGVALPNLRDQVHKLGLENQVVFPGRVDPTTAALWYQALDLMTIPRVDAPVTRAVTPMKGLQAMAYGIPQVVSDLPALAEIATAEGQGVAIPAEEPRAWAAELERLLSDHEGYSQLVEAALKATSNHTWENRTLVYSRCYSSLQRE